ncbi:MAG TPA: SUF system Fe-S cluster assembly protein [Alphaproteobacteria bacterium]|nr:SUF system Fe-S cluster assembly protein [Alphaproteobacteria bacterium]
MDDGFDWRESPYVPEAAASGATVKVGEALPSGAAPASFDEVVAALRTVYDPEIPVNIYDLGLIYKLEIDDRGDVAIEMTLTAPACPVAGSLPGAVANAVSQVEGTGEVEVKLVWDPPWSTARMSDDAKLALGMD